MHQFKIILSPILEENIKQSIRQNDKGLCAKTVKFLLNRIDELDNYSSNIILVFPLELKAFIEEHIKNHCDENSSQLYKILIERLNNVSNEVHFLKQQKIPNNKCSSKFSINNTDFNDNTNYSKNLFLHFLNEGNFSFFLDESTNLFIKKNRCPNRQCLSEEDIFRGDTNIKCAINIDLKFKKKTENIDDIINFLIEQNYENNIFKLKKINESTINDIMFLIYKSLGKDTNSNDYIEMISKVKYHNQFFKDMEDLSIQENKDLLTSLFCGIMYPRIGKTFSIECHENNPRIMNDCKLFRIYVNTFDYERKRFKGKAGKKRILKALAPNGKIFVLAYTNNHDFDQEMIKRRLNSISDY